MKSLIFVVFALVFAQRAFAGDCQYRFSQSMGEFQVIPAGFTGLMTCNAADMKKLVAKVTEEISKQLDKENKGTSSAVLPTVTAQFGKLSFYPTLRAEIAKALKEDPNWDKATGKSKADTMNDPVATAFLRSSFAQSLNQKGLIIDEAGIESITTVPASQLKIRGIKSGLYPESGTLKLVFHKETPHPSPSPFKERAKGEPRRPAPTAAPETGTSATETFPDGDPE